MELVFMLVVASLFAVALAGGLAAMALTGIKNGEWPVLRRRRVVYRGFVVR